MVCSGLTTLCRLAARPTYRSPVFGLTATTDGVNREPSAFSMMMGCPASTYAATELVVPRSMPSTFGMA